MRLPKTTKSRVWLAVGALTALAVIAFGITAYNLWQDGNTPSASKSKTDKNGDGIPDGPTDYPTFAGPSASTSGIPGNKIDLSQIGTGTNGVDPFAKASGVAEPHKVTVQVTSDGAIYVGYRYRDGKGSGTMVANRTFRHTRTVNGPLPVALTGIKVMLNATYSTCTVLIDGVAVDSNTARGAGAVTICLG